MTLRSMLAVSLALAAPAAFAQPSPAPSEDPVLVYFRESRAALDRGDAAAAEAPAQLALEASKTVNGPRTAILALNLATLRLDLDKPEAAHAPALLAFELATADADSGVDPLTAALALGRAELAADSAAGVARLHEALARAGGRDDLQSAAYSAAVGLARTTFALQQYAAASEAWETAARFVAGSPDNPAFAAGLARAGEGAAIFMDAMQRERPGVEGSPITSIDGRAAREANAALTEALDLLEPLAESAESTPTAAQGAYAQALAWQGALRAKMQGQGEALPQDEHAARTASGATERCAVRLLAEPAPAYPSQALLGAGFGAVVMRFRTDDRGAIVERRIAAAIPTGSFSDAVAAVADEWRIEVTRDAASACRVEGTRYVPILFVAAEEAAPDTSASAIADEIIVRGRTGSALRAELERTENAIFERFNALNSNDDFDIRCTRERRYFSHMWERVCAPVFLRDHQAPAAQDFVRGFRSSEQFYAGASSYQYRRLHEEMRRLARSDEQLLAALSRWLELNHISPNTPPAGER
jgi:hypothetical protein